jgi:hypothetical protein
MLSSFAYVRLSEDCDPCQGTQETGEEPAVPTWLILWCVSQFSVAVTKYLSKSTFKKERFILADDCRGFRP